jgi:hypothetical protein
VPQITEDGFLALCNEGEREYFGQVVEHVRREGIPYRRGSRGMSIVNGAVQCFPSDSRRNLEVHTERLGAELAAAARRHLSDQGLAPERCARKVITFRSSEVAAAAVSQLLSLLCEEAGNGSSA